MADYGVTDKGFVTRALPEIRDDLRAALQARFGGTTVDLSSTGVLSQLVDIVANALSDLWDASAGIYAGSYPSGASGTQVDNLLTIAGLARLPARATVTNPTPATDDGGNPLYGLVVYGSAGASLPAGSLLSNGTAQPTQFATDAAIVVGPSANALQSVQFTSTPTSGSYQLSLTTQGGETLTTASIPAQASATATTLNFQSALGNDNSDWTLTVGDQTLTFSVIAGAQELQTSLRNLPTYASVTVLGSRQNGMQVFWPSVAPSLDADGTNGPVSIVPSVRDAVWSLKQGDGKRPFGDVDVQAYGQGFSLAFGTLKPLDSAPSNAALPMPLATATQNALFRGSVSVSVDAFHVVTGHPSQGTGSATATTAGASEVLAGQLSTIVQPATGVTGVTNQLDCVSGRDIETDLAAIARLQASASQTTATISAIISAVLGVSGVTQAIAFANTSNASQQQLTFATAPTTGSFAISVAGQTTASLPYSATAQDVQSTIQALPGLPDVTVTTAGQSSFLLQFGALSGHLPHDLALVASNSTDATLTASFACPAHAVEIVAQGGSSDAIARAILSTLPAGIASYGRSAASPTAALTTGQATATLSSANGAEAGQLVDAAHLPTGAQIGSLTGTSAVFTLAATASNANEQLSLTYGALLDDGAGNSVVVRFSRPSPVTVYANLKIVTDKSSSSAFQPSSVAQIHATLIAIINAIPIGKPVLVTGTQGLLNSFRDVPGVNSASLTIGRSPTSMSSDALVLAPNESPIAASSTINIEIA